jgi:hypothetical protein
MAAAAQTGVPSRAADADALVQTVMQFPTRITGLSFLVKQSRLLGDAVAGAIARRLRTADLLDSEKAHPVLDLVGSAFEEPSFIQADEDKKPGVTLLLLDHLSNYSPDSSVRQRASDMITNITKAK